MSVSNLVYYLRYTDEWYLVFVQLVRAGSAAARLLPPLVSRAGCGPPPTF